MRPKNGHTNFEQLLRLMHTDDEQTLLRLVLAKGLHPTVGHSDWTISREFVVDKCPQRM